MWFVLCRDDVDAMYLQINRTKCGLCCVMMMLMQCIFANH